MSLDAMFATDAELEKNGVEIEYPDDRITLARAGGSNTKFKKMQEAKMKPYMRAVQAGTLDEEIAKRILRELYAAACIKNWEVRETDPKTGEDKWRVACRDTDGKPCEFNYENVVAALKRLPEFFADLQKQGGNHTLYLATLREDAAGN